MLISPTDIDECASETCLNGGTCVELVDAFLCICADGYNGTICEAGVYAFIYTFSPLQPKE